jgi:hypothetical protein
MFFLQKFNMLNLNIDVDVTSWCKFELDEIP